MRTRTTRLLAPGALALAALTAGPAAAASPAPTPADRPRVVVLTDIANEPDDEESMVRFLAYANEFEVEGLVATTSTHLKKATRPDIIRRQIEAYRQVLPNLRTHAPGYPSAEALLAVVKSGRAAYGMEGVGDGMSSEGSELIVRAADRRDPRPLWISVWGGANTLAQALWDVRRTRSPAEVDALVAKLRVYTISDQDDSGRWLRDTFPRLSYIVSPGGDYHLSTWSGISGDRFYKNAPMSDFHLVDNPWLDVNVREGHGPLGALYPRAAFIMEGDTPSFLNLIGNGLASHVDAGWGGWGGRYQLKHSYGDSRPIWTNTRDTVRARDGSLHTTNQATIWRWREAYQHDFAARMDWCVAKRFKDANHNPIAVLNGDRGKRPVHVTVESGKEVKLDAAGTRDPDGDAIKLRWWVYPEAGSFGQTVPLSSESGTATAFVAPEVKKERTVHVILEVTDEGTPRLYSYRRAVVTVQPSAPRTASREN